MYQNDCFITAANDCQGYDSIQAAMSKASSKLVAEVSKRAKPKKVPAAKSHGKIWWEEVLRFLEADLAAAAWMWSTHIVYKSACSILCRFTPTPTDDICSQAAQWFNPAWLVHASTTSSTTHAHKVAWLRRVHPQNRDTCASAKASHECHRMATKSWLGCPHEQVLPFHSAVTLQCTCSTCTLFSCDYNIVHLCARCPWWPK